MSRNGYTPLVRQRQRAQIAKQEKELIAIAQRLSCLDEGATEIPTTTKAKARRSARLEQTRRRKSERETSNQSQ
jgi:hypothetical protein